MCAKLSKAKQRRVASVCWNSSRRSARRCCRSSFCQQRTLGRLSGRAPTLIASAKQVSAHAAAVNSSVDAFGQSGTALSGVEPAAGDPTFGQSLGTRITSLGTSSGAAHHGAAESQEQALAHADDADGAPDGASDLSDTEWSAHAAAENLGRKRAYSPRKQPSRQAALNGNTTPLSQKREPKKTRQNHRR